MMQPSQGVPSYIDYTGVQSVQHPDFDRTVPVLYNVLFHTFAVIAKIDFLYIFWNIKEMSQNSGYVPLFWVGFSAFGAGTGYI